MMKPTNESTLAVWASRTCLESHPVKNMLECAEAARSQNCDCHFLLGSRLTKTNRAYLVYLLGCEFFAFCLTDEQTQAEGADCQRLWTSIDGPRLIPPSRFPLHLHRVEIEQEQKLNLRESITGHCLVRSEAQAVANVCLRFQTILRVRNSTATIRQIAYFYPKVHQGETLPFKFAAMRTPNDLTEYASPQTAAIFVRYASVPDTRTKLGFPLSNVVGTVATFI